MHGRTPNSLTRLDVLEKAAKDAVHQGRRQRLVAGGPATAVQHTAGMLRSVLATLDALAPCSAQQLKRLVIVDLARRCNIQLWLEDTSEYVVCN
jgi:hypothetical protein